MGELRDAMCANEHFTLLGRRRETDHFVFRLSSREEYPIPASGVKAQHLMILHGDTGWWNSWLMECPDCEGLTGKGSANGLVALTGIWADRCRELPPIGEAGSGRGMATNGEYNLGDRILALDGTERPNLRERGSRHEVRPPLPDVGGHDVRGFGLFADLCREVMRLRVNEPIEALIPMGWLASAPLFGALDFRPHVYVVGSKNSGKTYLKDIGLTLYGRITDAQFKAAAMNSGTFIVPLLGEPSYAGLKNYFQQDSIPMLVDEAEAKGGGRQLAAMQECLRFLLHSSSGADLSIRSNSRQEVLMTSPQVSAMLFSTSAPKLAGAMQDRVVEVGYGKGEGLSEEEFMGTEAVIEGLASELLPIFVPNILHHREAWIREVYGENWRAVLNPAEARERHPKGGLVAELRGEMGLRQAKIFAPMLAGLLVQSGGALEPEVARLTAHVRDKTRRKRQTVRADGLAWINAALSLRMDRNSRDSWHSLALSLYRKCGAEGRPRLIRRSDQNDREHGALSAVGIRMRTNGDIVLNEEHQGFVRLLREIEIHQDINPRHTLLGADGVRVEPGLELNIDGHRDRDPLVIPLEVWNGRRDTGDE